METTRRCRKCGEVKPLTVEFFGRNPAHSGGMNAQCKACRAAYAKARKAADPEGSAAKQREIQARYRARHADKLRAQTKEYWRRWREANPEKVKAQTAAWRSANEDKVKAGIARWQANNKDRVRALSRAWQAANREKCREKTRRSRLKNLSGDAAKSKRWREANPDKVRDMKNRMYAEIMAENGARAIHKRVSNLVAQTINKRLSTGKGGRSWVALLGYDVHEFMQHIERQFTGKMSWENWGPYWHLDHIVPVSSFSFSSTECPEFRACWALTNLRPLRAIENLKKASKRQHLL